MNDQAEITGTKPWRHKLMLSTYRGKSKGYCRCGWQSTPTTNDESAQIVEQHTRHTGLVEHQPKTI